MDLGRAGREKAMDIESGERRWNVGGIPHDPEASFRHPLFHHARLCNGSIRVASDRDGVVTNDAEVAIVRRLTIHLNSAVDDPNDEPDRARTLVA